MALSLFDSRFFFFLLFCELNILTLFFFRLSEDKNLKSAFLTFEKQYLSTLIFNRLSIQGITAVKYRQNKFEYKTINKKLSMVFPFDNDEESEEESEDNDFIVVNGLRIRYPPPPSISRDDGNKIFVSCESSC